MPLICLIGRHGSGKSTVGAELSSYGYRHLSVGLLRRLGKSNQYPADIPAILMSAMRRERPGASLATATAMKLIALARSSEDTVLDGFPASIEHASLLPPETIFFVLWTPTTQRIQRLNDRALSTQRQWQPGRPSDRETALPELIRHVRRHYRCMFVANRSDAAAVAADMVKKLR